MLHIATSNHRLVSLRPYYTERPATSQSEQMLHTMTSESKSVIYRATSDQLIKDSVTQSEW